MKNNCSGPSMKCKASVIQGPSLWVHREAVQENWINSEHKEKCQEATGGRRMGGSRWEITNRKHQKEVRIVLDNRILTNVSPA
jgi:hypothetical protein